MKRKFEEIKKEAKRRGIEIKKNEDVILLGILFAIEDLIR